MKPSTILGAVSAHATVRATAADFAALRQEVHSALQLPPTFLKHADEQTVAALTAVLRACREQNLPLETFADWGVLAAPRFIGRTALPPMIQRFQTEGAWGVTPHFIPHHSLHSVSGMISLALKIHGPNYGVGGGPGAWTEALFTGLALLTEGTLPGVWVVGSGWSPEPFAEDADAHAECLGVALALTSPPDGWTGPYLRCTDGRLTFSGLPPDGSLDLEPAARAREDKNLARAAGSQLPVGVPL